MIVSAESSSFTSVFETVPGIMKRAPLGSRSSGGVESSSPISSTYDALITDKSFLKHCCKIDHQEIKKISAFIIMLAGE